MLYESAPQAIHDSQHITSPTSIIESCYDHTATCPGTKEKSSFEDSEYGKPLGMFEHLSGYDAIEAIVSAVNKGLNYTVPTEKGSESGKRQYTYIS
jgi:hypothetical protein